MDSMTRSIIVRNRAAKIKSIIKAVAAGAFLISTVVAISGCTPPPPPPIDLESLGLGSSDLGPPIINNTGVALTHIYIRTAGNTDWEEFRHTSFPRNKSTCLLNSNNSNDFFEKGSDGKAVLDNSLDDGKMYCSMLFIMLSQPQHYKFGKIIDIKCVDVNGFVYIKSNISVDPKLTERIVITGDDMSPMLIITNNTGLPINLTSPVTVNIGVGGSQTITEFTNSKQFVSYSIGSYRFDKEVILDKPQVNLSLTDRPPTVTVQNNTGYPITITAPFSEAVHNGGTSSKYPKNSVNENPVISYICGTFAYTRETVIDNEDIVLTLTEKDRPPVVTLLNNTGNTVNIVFLRNTGSNWPEQNMLTLKLKTDGTLDTTQAATQAGERRGSFTNKETFRFWMGNVKGLKPGSYDIRLDDVQGNPYVKSGVHITEDATLTFTPKDKP